jgi:amidase
LPTGITEYDAYDGLGLAELVRAREVTPAELVEAAIVRVEARNPALNAVIHTMYESARGEASAPLDDGPFAGVPFLLKDLLAAYAGEPLTSGSRLLRNYVPDFDSEMVKRYKRAGFITIGKTATPEFGIMGVTEPALWGPTRNPWDTERTPGGSSGGSGAAIAARMVPIASGGDGGGSIRIPSSACGLFGLKPSRGRTPHGPVDVEYWAGCTVEHVLTRTVRDSAAVLDAVSAPESGAVLQVGRPDRPYLQEVGAPAGTLRIACSAEPAVPAEVHPDCVAAMDDAATLCEELGHELVEARPSVDGEEFTMAFLTMLAGEIAADVREAERLAGHAARSGDIEVVTDFLRLLGRQTPADQYACAVRDLKRLSRTLDAFFDQYDVLLTPTLARPPVPIGSIVPSGSQELLLKAVVALKAGRPLRAMGVLEQQAQAMFAFTPFTMLFNASGNPAMSVPLMWNAEGLPTGVQFVAPTGDEATLVRLASQLEEARPWAARQPELAPA